MGKAISFYAKDEVVDFLENEDNKSELLNRIVLEYFQENEIHLKRELQKVDNRLEYLKSKLQHLKETQTKEQELKSLKQSENKVKKDQEKLYDRWLGAWREELITDEFYYMGHDDKTMQFIKNKLKELGLL